MMSPRFSGIHIHREPTALNVRFYKSEQNHLKTDELIISAEAINGGECPTAFRIRHPDIAKFCNSQQMMGQFVQNLVVFFMTNAIPKGQENQGDNNKIREALKLTERAIYQQSLGKADITENDLRFELPQSSAVKLGVCNPTGDSNPIIFTVPLLEAEQAQWNILFEPTPVESTGASAPPAAPAPPSWRERLAAALKFW